VKEKYLLLQNKGYVNGYISDFHQKNSRKTVLLLPFLTPCLSQKRQSRINDTKLPYSTPANAVKIATAFFSNQDPIPGGLLSVPPH
jgi:hypothetical protein